MDARPVGAYSKSFTTGNVSSRWLLNSEVLVGERIMMVEAP